LTAQDSQSVRHPKVVVVGGHSFLAVEEEAAEGHPSQGAGAVEEGVAAVRPSMAWAVVAAAAAVVAAGQQGLPSR
jgi:hypothetical protein